MCAYCWPWLFAMSRRGRLRLTKAVCRSFVLPASAFAPVTVPNADARASEFGIPRPAADQARKVRLNSGSRFCFPGLARYVMWIATGLKVLRHCRET